VSRYFTAENYNDWTHRLLGCTLAIARETTMPYIWMIGLGLLR